MAASLPPPPPEQIAALERIAESQRPWVEAAIAAAAKGRPAKQLVATRLDGDVLTWLKSFGDGYSSRINRILRAVMEAGQS